MVVQVCQWVLGFVDMLSLCLRGFTLLHVQCVHRNRRPSKNKNLPNHTASYYLGETSCRGVKTASFNWCPNAQSSQKNWLVTFNVWTYLILHTIQPLIFNLFFQITYLHFSTNKKDTFIYLFHTHKFENNKQTPLLVFFSLERKHVLVPEVFFFSQIASVNYKNTPQNRKNE